MGEVEEETSVKPRFALCVFFLCMAVGCQDDQNYRIVGSKRYHDSHRPENDDELILFTIKHGKTTFTAHCEMLDVKNNCRLLEVGKSYPFKREKSIPDWLTLENPYAVLGIESETVQ
jgi:hypothetical protein